LLHLFSKNFILRYDIQVSTILFFEGRNSTIGGKNHMNRKLATIGIVIILIILSTTTVSNAKLTRQQLTKHEIPETLNKEIFLGSATIFGDGTEENTTVDAEVEIDIDIGIDSVTQPVDLYITYDIDCNGSIDDGRVYFVAQLNGAMIGNISATSSENEEDVLKFESVQVKRGDVLTTKIGAFYTNLDPFFVVLDVAVGGGVFSKTTTFHPHMFPLLRQLLGL
jgi:hypothetical protein